MGFALPFGQAMSNGRQVELLPVAAINFEIKYES
jgi:hypothetical protein